MIVVDTSAVVGFVTSLPYRPALTQRLRDDGDLHAPHLIDVELLHVLRRLLRTGELTGRRVQGAREDLAVLPITRYPHTHLLDRAWELRDNVTAHDAMFVALAEILGVPLVTVDARLAAATGHRATIELL